MDSLNQRARHIFLSPHLDDAVFSCGGLIAKAVSLGCPVEVRTFYTGQADGAAVPRRQRKAAATGERKREDSTALDHLGATPVWLDYTGRFLRPPWLERPLHIFRTPSEAGLGGFPNIPSIRRDLSRLLNEWPQAYLFAPLGVGGHYDHVELFLASITTAVEEDALDRFLFYEDSYSLGTRMRKRHFVARRVCWSWWQAPACRSIAWFVISNLMASQGKGRAVLEFLPPHYRRLQWTVRLEAIQNFEDQKLDALSAYESQVKALGGAPMFARIIRHYHRFWGNAEPYWVAGQC